MYVPNLVAIQQRIDILAWNNLVLPILYAFNLLERICLLHSRCIAKVEGRTVSSVEESIVEEAIRKVVAVPNDCILRIAVFSEKHRIELSAVLVRKVIDAVERRRCGCGRFIVVVVGVVGVG